jgi:hypothetical protein
MLTREQIGYELADIFAAILPELSPNNIRRAYQKKTMPGMKETDNYLFFWLTTFDEPFQAPTEKTFNADTETMEYSATKGLVCNVTFYGDQAQELALKLEQLSKKQRFFKNLRLNDVYLISHHQTPRVIQDLINGQWYLRADLTLRFYQKVSCVTDENLIKSAEIGIYADGSAGDEETGFITKIEISEEYTNLP